VGDVKVEVEEKVKAGGWRRKAGGKMSKFKIQMTNGK